MIRKTSGAGGALVGGAGGGHSTQVGRLGPRERSSGIMVREMASASWSKVKRRDGDDVPLNREKNTSPALRSNFLSLTHLQLAEQRWGCL